MVSVQRLLVPQLIFFLLQVSPRVTYQNQGSGVSLIILLPEAQDTITTEIIKELFGGLPKTHMSI